MLTGCKQSGSNTNNNIKITQNIQNTELICGADQTELYFELLKGKNICIVTNQTGTIGDRHLPDSLYSAGFKIKAIFAPEHGFRGHGEAGEHISNSIDEQTGIQIISLYGRNYKPVKEDLQDMDLMIFDIQDVGVRFYTYISTLHYVMEACAENNITLLILDRPNPNGFYVDGPSLDLKFQSFIGMHPVPVVYGMTIGEYAQMLNGEKWLGNGLECNLIIISVKNYTHNTLYELPIRPSPNLQSQEAIYLYPSVCLFEGTVMSVGRGTNSPFEIIGHPNYPDTSFSFTPVSLEGFSKNPKFKNKKCYGLNLKNFASTIVTTDKKIVLSWLIDSYNALNLGEKFFEKNLFDKLAGTDKLRKQIITGVSEDEIRESWEQDIEKFKEIRKKYLLYPDFE